jgi:predicted phosphate transport protein (TIGR00153 family)
MKFKLWKRQESIMGKIDAYLTQVDSCRDLFVAAIGALVVDPAQVPGRRIADVHDAEAKADDLRREIELDLYRKALIPESRGDVLGMIEAVDRIPNAFEHIVLEMHTEQQIVPKRFQDRFLELVQVNVDAYNALRDAIRDFFHNRSDVLDRLGHIDERESRSDKLQRKLVKGIFADDMPTAEKILLRDLVRRIGKISDRAESCADRLTLAAVKRRP